MSPEISIGELLESTRLQLLNSGYSDSPSLEAQWIFEKATGLHRPEIFAHPERIPTVEQRKQIAEMTSAVISGEPLPYVLGEWSFFGNSFFVTPDVLIPRPETEMIVEKAIQWLEMHPFVTNFADIGTGSGCIAISIARYFSNRPLTAIAADRSLAALNIAQMNIDKFQLSGQILPVQADLTQAFAAPLHLVCANLPYIPSARCVDLEVSLHEPILSLDGGADGFDYYRLMLADLSRKMADEFLIFCEIDFTQKNISLSCAQHFFPEAQITIRDDYAGLSRILEIRNG